MEKDQVFFWTLLVFFCGIAGGSFADLPLALLMSLGGVFVLAVGAVFPKKESVFLGLLLCSFLFGATIASSERLAYQTLPELSEPVSGIVRIISDPEERDFYRKTIVRFLECETGSCPATRILWQAPLSFSGGAGAAFHFSCQLERPKNFQEGFDYPMFLAKDGIGYLCTSGKAGEFRATDLSGQLYAALYAPKHVVERTLSLILTEPEAGLAKGLLLGGDNYLPRELKESFTRVGLSHMIAVSGYNIMLIAQALLMMGLFFGLWRRQAVWATLVGILFFILMIGLPASAARAGAMASVVFLAFQMGRLARPVNALLFAGGVMLLFNPLLFRYDLGFQLSFLATLGILWVVPYYERFAPEGLITKKLGEVLVMTFAVELFVLPVILFSFHTFSPLVIIGNFLVFLVPLAMMISFGAVLLFFIFPGAHLLFAWVSFGLLTTMTRSVEWLGSFRGASITAESFGLWALIGWYLALGILVAGLGRLYAEKTYGQKP